MKYIQQRVLNLDPTIQGQEAEKLYIALSRYEMWRKYTQADHGLLPYYADKFLHYHGTWQSPFDKNKQIHFWKPMAVFGFSNEGASYKGSIYLNGAVVAIRSTGEGDFIEHYIDHYTAMKLDYPKFKFDMNGRRYE